MRRTEALLSGLHGLGDLGSRRKGWAHSTLICFRALPLNGLLLLCLSILTGVPALSSGRTDHGSDLEGCIRAACAWDTDAWQSIQ